MTPEHIAAFSQGNTGGNPAGVVISDHLPDPAKMQAIAREIGYSETAFAAPQGSDWIVRYFAPEGEVAFCGHATIALGAALGRKHGAGRFDLELSEGRISVTASQTPEGWTAELLSPNTWSRPLDDVLLQSLLGLFDLTRDQLDPQFPPTLAFAGVQHGVLALKDRDVLAQMHYDFDAGRKLMLDNDLTTVSLLHITSPTQFVSRNAFASGGVVEDPATGAAAAALAGALVDLSWPALQGGGAFTILQGEDLGQPSVLNVHVSGLSGDSVRVGGMARVM